MKQYEHKTINAHCISEVVKAGQEGWKAYHINGGVMYLNREKDTSIFMARESTETIIKEPIKTVHYFVCKFCPVPCNAKIEGIGVSKPNSCLYKYTQSFEWEEI